MFPADNNNEDKNKKRNSFCSLLDQGHITYIVTYSNLKSLMAKSCSCVRQLQSPVFNKEIKLLRNQEPCWRSSDVLLHSLSVPGWLDDRQSSCFCGKQEGTLFFYFLCRQVVNG
jgi:hypothetical protein